MPDDAMIAVKPEIAAKASINTDRHRAMSEAAARDPEGFWRGEMRRVAWMKEPTRIKSADFTGNVSIRWFEDGVLNASVSCLDRHVEAGNGDRVAIIWEGDDPNSDSKVTYRELHRRVCQLANAMRGLGVKKGDRVCIYLPMIVEAAVAMLACARIGAVHSIVFGGFSPDSLASRIQDSECVLLDHRRRGPARRPQGAAEGQCRRGAEDLPLDPPRHRGPQHRRRGRRCRRAATSTGRAVRRAARHLRAGAHERGGPAVHPLHQRLHRQAEGRAAHHRRLPGLGVLHP
jgi:hypothetical protein